MTQVQPDYVGLMLLLPSEVLQLASKRKVNRSCSVSIERIIRLWENTRIVSYFII